MKACLVKAYRGGGDPSNRLDLESHLSQHGYDVVVFCPLGEEPVQRRPAETVVVHPIRLPWILAVLVRSQNILELIYSLLVSVELNASFGRACDVIWFHGSGFAALFYSILGQRRDTTIIYSDGGPAPRFVSPWIVRRISIFMHAVVYKRASGIVLFGARSFAEATNREFSLHSKKVLWSNPGIRTEEFRLKSCAPSGAQDWKTQSVLYVAGIAPRKNQLALLKAIPRILERHSDAEFNFVGPISDRKYYNGLVRYTQKERLSHVKFTGRIPEANLLEHYARADVVVLLSLGEGFAKVIVEAMACGKAIVASSIPENVECAKRGDEIIFVNPNDSLQVAAAVNLILDDPLTRDTLGSRARRTALEWYDFGKVSKSLMDFVDRIRSAERKDLARKARI